MHNAKILVIEDDPDLLALLEALLRHEGAQVRGARKGQEGLTLFRQERPDLVILDVMLPDISGWEVCESLRHFSDVPILMLTGLSTGQDMVRGLEGGADDFVTKPFASQVLLARIRALLRRPTMAGWSRKELAYDDGYLAVDLERRQVWICRERVRLSVTEHRLLDCLVQNRGRVLTHDELLATVWGNPYLGNPQYLHVYINRLRRKLEEDPAHPRYLLTEPGVGYLFVDQGG